MFARCLLFASLLTLPVMARPVTPDVLQTTPRATDTRLSPDGRYLAVQTSKADLSRNRTESRIDVYEVSSRKAISHYPGAWGARWSRDGQLLVSQKTAQGPQAFVTRAPAWNLKQATRVEGGVEGPVWSPDGRQLAFVSEVRASHPKYATGTDSGRLYDDLFTRRWDHVYNGKRQHLFVVSLGAPSRARDVTPGDIDAYPTSGTFEVGDNFCFSADGQALLYAAPPARAQASDTNYDVYRVALRGGRPENLTSANPAADLGPQLSPDGRRLYILAYQRPGYESEFSRVKSCPVDASGRVTGEWRYDSPEAEFAIHNLVVADNGLYYTRNQDARYYGCHRDWEGRETVLKVPGSLHALTSDRAGNRWAGCVGSLSAPPRAALGSLAQPQGQLLGAPSDLTVGTVESVEVPVEGAKMQMWLIKPPNFRSDQHWPVAFLVHGGPQGGWSDDWSVRWNAQAWAAQGYLVAMPNPRGSSGRGRAFQEGVSRDWGGKAYRDLMAGADYLKTLPYVDSTRMAAAGASYGGYMINWIATHTGRFRALVTHDGVWNLESMYGTTDELWFCDWEFGGPPWKVAEDYQSFSPHRFAEGLSRYRTPHLVIHNDLDFRCPLDQGLQLFTALKLQGVESRFLNFPDEGHWVLKPRNSVRWYREVFDFVEHYCPPGPN